MKQECPTYLKSIGKSKALATTLSDTKLEAESKDSDDEGILSAFTAIVDPTEGIIEAVDEEEDLVESKFEKMDNQDNIHTAYARLYKVFEKHKKLYRLATKKLSDVKLDREELSTKVDEANQTRPLELCSLRTISLLKGQRSLKQNCSKSELNWKGLLVQSSMRC